ncbi:MAG: PD40 domain-containing protein [Armatimonadota bacterium]|nr:MAG: PD40 domain-containing protein [Armatimonadota bacterium]
MYTTLRPDMLDEDSPEHIGIVQLTTETDVPSSHIYMEAQIFTPDSKRFLLHRSATPHGGSKNDPEHRYLVCDIEDNCSLYPVTEDIGAVAPSVSPDGRYVYYFVDETEVGGGRLTLKRVNIDGGGRTTIMALDAGLPGTGFYPSRIYPLSTISSDGTRLAAAAFLGDGQTDDAPFGLIVFDLEKATVELVIHGPTWCNLHPQYSRSTDADESHDIMIQENHDNTHDAQGKTTRLVGGLGADIHVIRDDGTDFRNLPWGRDGNEFCQGHQCWRGCSHWAITSTSTRRPPEAQLIEGLVAPHAGHVGIATPGGVRNDLSRDSPQPSFCHFATDIAGARLITDAGPQEDGGRIFVAKFGEPGSDALADWTHLLNPRSSWQKQAHVHPFLSPNGSLGFFNSDESGILQAYMIRGLDTL